MTVTEQELEEHEESGGPHPNRLLPPEERRKRGNMSKWRVGADGQEIMPPLQRQYLEEFLLTGRLAGQSKAAWCKEHGVSGRTVRNWERDERFIREWNKRIHQERLSPEFHEDIVKALRETATDRNHPQHVAAAKELIRLLGMIAPPTLNLNVNAAPDLASISDEELIGMVQHVELERGDDV